MSMTRKIRVAAVQAAPVFLDREATTEKAVAAILEAGRNGAELVVLPEALIPCYPTWIWTADSVVVGPELYARLCEQSVERGSETIAQLQQAAHEAGAVVACGINEREGATLYNAQVVIDAAGEVLGYRRKLMPTGAERTVWGRGDSRDIRVWDTPLGTLGALICYEHTMTPVKAALAGLGEEIHIAMWPAMPAEGELLSTETIAIAMRNYAWETQTFVVHATTWQSEEFTEASLAAQGGEAASPLVKSIAPLMAGMTGIVGPNGKHVAGPAPAGEHIVYADLDPAERLRAKYMVDGAGHYARSDAVSVVIHDPKPSLVEGGR
ncbi:MAG: carbon-nitrogen hydrolase family protein [Deltaproteobacteria bacterium]|nr:MAG: carbon-nitrogen hydrolase family protein [Deltaproteobacteria bacterium]